MTPSISTESTSLLLLNPVDVSYYSVLIVFFRVYEAWNPGEEWGDVQNLPSPITLLVKSLPHSPENRPEN